MTGFLSLREKNSESIVHLATRSVYLHSMTEILDDDALMAGIQDGDEQAFECLVNRWDVRIAMVIRRMGIADSDVDDLRQEVFIRVLRGANRYALRTCFSAWINRLTLNVIRDCQRKRVPKPMELDEVTSDLGDVVVHVADRELAGAVDAALQRMDEDQRVVLVLRHYGQLTFREISEVLNEPISTVKSRGQSGLIGLERELAKLGVSHEELRS